MVSQNLALPEMRRSVPGLGRWSVNDSNGEGWQVFNLMMHSSKLEGHRNERE
jgi:hypothetical protein